MRRGNQHAGGEPGDDRGGHTALLEAPDLHTVVRGPDRIAEPVTDVIDTEEAAEAVPATDTPQFMAWLFREDVEPRQVSREELATLAAEDESFVWVDLADYEPDDLAAVAQQLDLPESTLPVVLASWQRPRLGVYGDRFFVAVTVPHADLAAPRVWPVSSICMSGATIYSVSISAPCRLPSRCWPAPSRTRPCSSSTRPFCCRSSSTSCSPTMKG